MCVSRMTLATTTKKRKYLRFFGAVWVGPNVQIPQGIGIIANHIDRILTNSGLCTPGPNI